MDNTNETFKKCCRCEIIQVIEKFNKDKNRKDGLNSICKLCRKKYYNENLVKIRKYNEQNKERRNIYLQNKRETDVNFRIISNTRSRIYKSLKGMTKQSSTKETLGIDFDTYRKWIEYQFTPEMNWSNFEIDHVKAICLFDVSNAEELGEAFNGKNTQPLLKKVHQQKGTKFNFLDYQLQFIKAYQFLKLNEEERLNENIH